MLIQNQKRQRSRPGLNIAAMIDVVFLLMIFFVCTSSFQVPEHQMPSATASNQAAAETMDFEPVRIELRRAEKEVQILCDGQVCASFEALTEQLRRRRRIADMPVIIRGQNEVPFEAMVKALNASRRADLKQAAFAVEDAKSK